MVSSARSKRLRGLAVGVLAATACSTILGIEERPPFPESDAAVDASLESTTDVETWDSADAGDAALDSTQDVVPDADAGDGGLFANPSPLAVNQTAPHGIAVDAQRVYWTQLGENGVIWGIEKAPDSGASPFAFKTQVWDATEIAVDSERIYFLLLGNWCFDWGVHSIEKQSLVSKPITPGCDFLPVRMAIDDDHVYESRFGSQVRAAAKDGGPVVDVVIGLANLSAVTTAAGWFYYASDKAIYRRLGGLTPASGDGGADAGDELFVGNLSGVTDMVGDATDLFWVETSGKVLRRAHAGGSTIELATGQNKPARLAIDATHVFWPHGDFAIRAVAKNGSLDGGDGVIEIASGQAKPLGIAADADGVYWTNSGNGTVMMARRQP